MSREVFVVKETEPDQLIPVVIACREDSFESLVVCAIRYCLGRKSYMPSVIIEAALPFLPHLSKNTLHVLQRDINSAQSYGMSMDKSAWMIFLEHIDAEITKR